MKNPKKRRNKLIILINNNVSNQFTIDFMVSEDDMVFEDEI